MIRTSLILLLLALLIGSLLYFRVPPSSVLRMQQYAGIQNCRGCHATPASGDQFTLWQASPHAHAFEALRGDSALAHVHTPANPPDADTACLCCHATAYSAASELRGPEFRFEDGVTCEACHGASSDYATYAAMRDHKVFLRLGGKNGTDSDCVACHGSSRNNHVCPVVHPPFIVSTAMRAIAHPMPHTNGIQ